MLDQKTYLCNGKIEKWSGTNIVVQSPICENGKRIIIGSYPAMDKNTALEILNAAVNAYASCVGAWPTFSVQTRIKYVRQFTEEMKKHKTNIVNLLMWEIGKNHSDSEKEFYRTITYINQTINALIDLDRTSSKFITEEGILAQIRRSPLGVVLCMAPFNYPLNELFTTLIPALIMGNTVIFKPAKFGILLFEPLLEAFKIFPPGVVNTLYGDGKEIIPPIIASGKIDVLAFIGSSKVADILKKQHPKPHRLKCILGLDAKNIGIITKSVLDMEYVINECVKATLTFNGQRCTALKLLFVHNSIKNQFVPEFIAKIRTLKIGMPWDNADITPLPEENKSEYLMSLVNDAMEKGAKEIVLSHDIKCPTLFNPVVLTGVTKEMRIFHEEQFGPIIPIVFYETIEEPIKAIIDSNFGQQASIFSTNPQEISELIDILTNQVSRVNINCQCQRGPDTFPFNGRKDSAEGTLSISDALKVFSIRSIVATKETDKEIFKEIIGKNLSNFLNTNYIL